MSPTIVTTPDKAARPVAGRIITSRFRKRYFRICTENPVLGVLLIPPIVFGQAFLYLPRLLRLRQQLRKRSKDPADPRIVFWSDTLDEVNGIANNIRLTVKTQIGKGRKAHLIGAVHRFREGGKAENHFVVLFPLIFAMPQLGYPDSELSIPHMKPLLRWIKRYPPDLVELETPNPGSWVMMCICKILGIPVISHYRTDANGYTRMLVKVRFMHWYVGQLVKLFSHLTTPVVTPSRDFQQIVMREMGLPSEKVVLLPRGIDLAHFSPERRNAGFWPQYHTAGKTVRFLFVGRVSLEKSLPFMEEAWRGFRTQEPDAELLVVGHGPYLEEMRSRMADCSEVVFTGQLSGAPLYSLYAEADYFLFTSGNDTFGNVIVESLASGTPALISDRGGPKDIVEGTDCGVVIPFRDQAAWVQTMLEVARFRREKPEAYTELRCRCWEQSRRFSLENACDAQWEFLSKLATRSR